MFEFYLAIIDSLVKTHKHSFINKFNNLVYADCNLTADEKLCLFGEIQKRWQKSVEKTTENNNSLNYKA